MIGTLLDRLYDEVRRIWCYRWLAAAVSAAVLAAAVAFVMAIPSTYEAWGQIYVNAKSPVAAAAEGVSLVGENDGSSYVVQKTLLNDDNLAAVARRLRASDRSTSQQNLAATAAGLRAGVRVVDGGDGFVEIHFTDRDPVRAQRVVSLLIDQFISRNVSRSQEDLSRAGAFLDEQIASYETMISQSQGEISAFRRTHPGSGPGEAAATELVADTAPAPAPSPPPSSAAAQLERDLATLLTTYTDRHPDVIAARRRLAEAKAEAASEAAAAPASHSASVRRLVRRAAPPMAPEAAAQLAELRRKDEVLRTNYQQLIAKRAAARMSQDLYGADQGGKYQITRQPTAPTSPTGPNRELYLAAGLLLALGSGLGAAYLRAAMRGILVSAREMEEVIQLPVIGAVSWEPAWRARPGFSRRFDAGRPSRARRLRLRLRLRLNLPEETAR